MAPMVGTTGGGHLLVGHIVIAVKVGLTDQLLHLDDVNQTIFSLPADWLHRGSDSALWTKGSPQDQEHPTAAPTLCANKLELNLG